MQYTFSFKNPSRQIIDICFEISDNKAESILVQLPSWRPGRYELGNFAKNILGFRVENEKGEKLNFEKQTKDSWMILADSNAVIKVIYEYYASDLNAGSTYLDGGQLYVNPVNCCVFIPERINETCLLELRVDDNCLIACDLPQIKPKIFSAESFHRLADAPFIASAGLQHRQFSEAEHIFHLWFMGNVQPDWERLERDFRAFCKVQLQMMGALPGKEYHFIFQILPVFFYHGVEHTFSTVCALGPGNTLFSSDFYNELLGVSSHELFHAWNVKTIRPSEMHPYEYTRENYSRLGWVYEGITTYYGDQFLLRSGVFDLNTFFGTFNEKLRKHFASYGRFNQPVSEASFDTWLDGYVPGIPHRKTSIYTEGNLCAFMLDIIIRKNSNEQFSLDDLMRRLYDDAKAEKPYNKEKLISELEKLAPYDFAGFYRTYIEGTTDYESLLSDCLEYIGLELLKDYPLTDAEHQFGFTAIESSAGTLVSLVAPGSPAEKAGMMAGDQLIAFNGTKIKGKFPASGKASGTIILHAFSKESIKEFNMSSDGSHYFESRRLNVIENLSLNQQRSWESWSGNGRMMSR